MMLTNRELRMESIQEWGQPSSLLGKSMYVQYV